MPQTHRHTHSHLSALFALNFWPPFAWAQLDFKFKLSSCCNHFLIWMHEKIYAKKKKSKKMKHYIKIASNQQQHKSETKTRRWRERRKTISSLAVQRKSGKSRFAAATATTTTTFTQRRRRIFLETPDGHERKWAQDQTREPEERK